MTSKGDPEEGQKGRGGGSDVPGWAIVAAVLGATLILFRDFVFSDGMLFGSDTVSLGYVARDFFADAVTEDGVFPRWNPLLLGGTPFLESLSGGDTLYPTTLLLFLVEPYRALGWKLIVHVAAAGLFTYGWVRVLGRSRAAALVAGLAYAVAPFLVSFVRPGHDGKLFVTALTPLLFWAMEATFRRRGLLPYVGVSLVVAVVILSTHFQFAYFLFGAAGLYYIARAFFLAGPDAGAPHRTEPSGDAANAGNASDAAGDPEGAAGGRRPRPAAGARRFALFLTASVLGAGVAGIQLLPAVEYVTESSRRTATTTAATEAENRAYASSWSLHPEEVVGLVVPEFPGNSAGGSEWTQGTYWGRNAFRDNHPYAGLIVLLLAVVGFLGTPRRGVRLFLAGIGGLALLYALGTHTPVWGLFFDFVPGVSLFRAADNAAFLFGFAAVTLAAFGVDRLLRMAPDGRVAEEKAGGKGSGKKKKGAGKTGESGGDATVVNVLLGLTGLLVFGTLLAASGGLFSFWTGAIYPEIDPRRLQTLERLRPFVVRGFFIATALAGALSACAWAARRGMLKRGMLVGMLTLLVFVDGARISASFVQTVDFEQYFGADTVTRELVARQQAETPFRVVDVTDGAGQATRLAHFGLELATGHHPNDLARYRELIGMAGSGQARHLIGPSNVGPLLNVRYVTLVTDQTGGPEPVAEVALQGGRFLRAYRAEAVYGAPGLPRARLVGDAVVVPDEEAVATILDPAFDPATTAVLSEPAGIDLPGGAVDGEVTWLERGLNRQRLRVANDRPALLVVADNWYPSWRARVDGEEREVLRAYHTLRAVALPAGEHEVELFYRSGILETSLWITLLSLVLLAAVAAVDVVRRRGRSPAADG